MKNLPAATRRLPLRGGLRVINGETLLPKLSDFSDAPPNVAIITAQRVSRAAAPRAAARQQSRVAEFRGAIRGLEVFISIAANGQAPLVAQLGGSRMKRWSPSCARSDAAIKTWFVIR